MYSIRRRQLSQNFFYSRKLIKQLIRQSSIGINDIVLDIGTGKGIITEELCKKVNKVIAIEIDTSFYLYLRNKLKLNSNVEFINQDFLMYKLPRYRYKVFANIPFSIEGKIIRKLLTASNPPQDSYLVMRKDLAERLSGKYKECQFSLLYKPWFNFQIIHKFRRTDFEPMAQMDTVLLRFTKRDNPLLSQGIQKKYSSFINQGFNDGRKIRHSLRAFFTHNQFSRASQIHHFNINAKPSRLNLNQWIGLFKLAQRSRFFTKILRKSE